MRLCRARADGPSHATATGISHSALPRPRGWTQLCAAELARGRGSSAPARMDRSRKAFWRGRRRLFRARADGPEAENYNWLGALALPRPRGWTIDGSSHRLRY